MRIIAGIAKGRRLRSLRGCAMRPTRDKVREALFNIIGSRIEGSCFIDLYAGTGGVGIEALSRGASMVTFVELHPPAVELIRANLATCGFSSKCKVIRGDAIRFIAGARRRCEKIDVIFMDPPYYSALAERTLKELAGANIIIPGGLVVVEHSSKLELAKAYSSLVLKETRRFGDTALSFYEPCENVT